MTILAINASTSPASTTHRLASLALTTAGEGSLIDISALDSEALVGRRQDVGVDDAIAAMTTAEILVLVTPVYRAAYSGLLKLLFDLLTPDALAGSACVLAATGATERHFLSLDTGLRSLVASVLGWSVPTVVYATASDVDESGKFSDHIQDSMTTALSEARRVASKP